MSLGVIFSKLTQITSIFDSERLSGGSENSSIDKEIDSMIQNVCLDRGREHTNKPGKEAKQKTGTELKS